MPLFRPVFAQHPLRFGRGPLRLAARPSRFFTNHLSDIRLFVFTFVAGFLFVSILIG